MLRGDDYPWVMARTASTRGCKRQARQRELFRRGGKRRGAGRKPQGARAGERHQARADFKPYHGLHVVVRVAPAVGSREAWKRAGGAISARTVPSKPR